MKDEPDGVTVYAHMLHTHGTGKKVNIHHFRGTEELPHIASDSKFDYNFQEVRLMKEPANLRPVSISNEIKSLATPAEWNPQVFSTKLSKNGTTLKFEHLNL